MKLFHPCAVFKLVLTGEYFLVRKATVFDWQERTVVGSTLSALPPFDGRFP